MPTEAEWIATIADDPENDGLRLVFADWLEEQGDTARAEFIRCAVELTHHASDVAILAADYLERERFERLRQRERELLGRHGRKWFDPIAKRLLPPEYFDGRYGEDARAVVRTDDWRNWIEYHVGELNSGPRWKIARGFVSAVTLSWEDWAAHADAILLAAPVVEVRLTNWPNIPKLAEAANVASPFVWEVTPAMTEGLLSKACPRIRKFVLPSMAFGSGL